MNLETLKNNFAQEQGYEDWELYFVNHFASSSFSMTATLTVFEGVMNEICIRAQKAALEKKIERMKAMRKVYDAGTGQHNILSILIKEFQVSITNPENLIR